MHNSATSVFLFSLGGPPLSSFGARGASSAEKLCDACGRQGGSLGELNHLIVLDQFQRLRAGDSWWYERSGVLDAATLLEVQGTLFVSQTLCLSCLSESR